MIALSSELELTRCPYCKVDKPSLGFNGSVIHTADYLGQNKRVWKTYACRRCGGVLIACAANDNERVIQFYPNAIDVDDSIPSPAKDYLQQAIDTLHAPSGSVLLSASAVDAMLKTKSYKDGSLASRIKKAVDDNLITSDMALWAHEVRLNANEQRHADDNMPLPTTEDAQKCVDFALALGTFLFVLPSRVKRGLEEATRK